MTTSPVDGDVWIGTEAGLTRYSMAKDTWSYYTRAEGLPSDQIQALAFAPDGTLYVGTQCDGLAIGSPKDGFSKWRVVQGPDKNGGGVPLTPAGVGLPSSLINCILVMPKRGGGGGETICVGTPSGLAVSTNDGRSWRYMRGRDYADKVRGLYGGAPKNWTEAQGAIKDQLLLEDYISGLAMDENGYLWIAYRQQGYEIRDIASNKKYRSVEDPNLTKVDGFISVVQPLPDDSPLIARYGGKLVQFAKKLPQRKGSKYKKKTSAVQVQQVQTNNTAESFPKHPSPAKPPSLEELQAAGEKIAAMTDQVKYPFVTYLGDDWVTQGDWVGRYGRLYTVLCAVNAPSDYVLAYSDRYYLVDARNGPHQEAGDAIRRWVHWLQSEDPRVLYNPMLGFRRQAEWDDHGEEYPMSRDGPDLWIEVKVPEGIHRVSMYFFNKDGHSEHNRFRDYMLEVYRWNSSFESLYRQKPLTEARIRDFWGGVYKQFVVAGPGKYLFRLDRNYSFNTIVSSVMLDRLAGPILDHEAFPLKAMGGKSYDPPVLDADYNTSEHPVHRLWYQLQDRWSSKNSILLQWKYGLYVYRHTMLDPALAKAIRWNMRLWTSEDRQEFKDVMQIGWETFAAENPEFVRLNQIPRDELIRQMNEQRNQKKK